MKKLIIILSLLLAATGCGKKKKAVPAPPEDIGKLTKVELSQENENQFFIRVASRSRSFDVTVQEEELADNPGIFFAKAKHTQKKIGSIDCLEFENSVCVTRQFSLNFIDCGIRYKGSFKVERPKDKLSVIFVEEEMNNNGTASGNSNQINYSNAIYQKVTYGNNELHGLYLVDYEHKVNVRDQVFIKKMYHPDLDRVRINIVGRLPKNSSNGENVYTDMHRDGFRSKQKSDVNFVHYYQRRSIVFEGVEAKNEFDRLFDDDNSKVYLKVVGLDALLNP